MNPPPTDESVRQESTSFSSLKKWFVVALLFIAILINYIDRGNLSIAAVPIMRDFGISPVVMGTLLSAFFWTYALFQIPAGYFVDRFNLKWLYAWSFLLWSLTSASVGFSRSFQEILLFRVLLGFVETIAHPASIRFIQRSFSVAEQGLPTSIYLAGMQIGPALGALVGALLLHAMGWRWLFVITGLGGCIWLIPWLTIVSNEPVHSVLPRADRLKIPWHLWIRPFRMTFIIGFLLVAFFYSYYWYFCLTWLPSYLLMSRGYSFLKMGSFTSLPLAGMALVSIASSRVADRIIARTNRPFFVRKSFVICGFLLGSLILLLPLLASSTAVLTTILASLLGIGVASANYWALIQVISPSEIVGRIIGCQNTVANIAGICAPLITGWTVNLMHNFNLAIIAAGFSLFVAAASLALLSQEKDAQALHQHFDLALSVTP